MSAKLNPPGPERFLLFDVGNTHVHVGVSVGDRILRQTNLKTVDWMGRSKPIIPSWLLKGPYHGAALCSVVPKAIPAIEKFVGTELGLELIKLGPSTARGIGIRYPEPQQIGPDRLANAIAVRHFYGAPAVVVDFGTAVTFDVVNRDGDYVGGIIAPGLSAMTDYLHEKTALLPRIQIREIKKVIGKNTEEAMLIGAVHGYRGLIRQLLVELKAELKADHLPVVATGGYAKLIASKIPEITEVREHLTLEGLRLVLAKV